MPRITGKNRLHIPIRVIGVIRGSMGVGAR